MFPIITKIKSAINEYSLNRSIRENIAESDCGFNNEPVTLFWSLDGGMPPHHEALCYLAKTLQDKGHHVLMLHCYQQLNRCPAMEACRLPIDPTKEEQKSVCLTCASNGIRLISKYNLNAVDIKDYLDRNERLDISNYIDNFDDLTELKFDDIGFGKISLGEAARILKVYSQAVIMNDHRDFLKNYIHTAISSYLAFKKLTKKFKINRLVYFGEYSMVLGVVCYAERNNIPVTNVSHASITNIDRNKIVLMSKIAILDYFKRLDRWKLLNNIPLNVDQVSEVGQDILFRFFKGGSIVYSPKKTNKAESLIDHYNLCSNRKLVTAFTSSLDEVFATRVQCEGMGLKIYTEEKLFANQIEWLKDLIEYVEKSTDLQLIVRIHPREGSIRDGGASSEHLSKLQENFKKSFKYVRIVWPDEDVSSYDLCEIADLVLIAWTTLGLEMARLGAPVLAAFRYTPYPFGDFIDYEDTKIAYFEKINELLCTQPSMSKVIKAFRWFYLLRLASSVDIRQEKTSQTKDNTSLSSNVSNLIESVLIEGQDLIELNMAAMIHNPLESEVSAIKFYLRKIIWITIFGYEREQDYLLKIEKSISNLELSKGNCLSLVIQGSKLCYQTENGMVEKSSPLCCRLAQLVSVT